MAAVKNITLTGDAYVPAAYKEGPDAQLAEENSTQRGGRRASRRRRMGGGAAAEPLPLSPGMERIVTVSKADPLAGYREPMGYQTPTYSHANGAPLQQAFRPVIPLQAQASIPVAAAAAPTPQAFQYGGAPHPTREVKVHLRPKHSGGPATSRKVHLKPKKTVAEATQKKLKLRHKTRKITLGLVSLAKRQTRAKKIKQKVAEMPIGELRAQLVKRGLIKEHSKAPESILRQIAADAQIVSRGDI
jgi:hypothetical protein